MKTTKTWLTLSLLALPLAGCSLLIDSSEYTSGSADGGTGDTGTMDTGMTDTGIPPGCDPPCAPEQTCIDHGDGTFGCEPGPTCGCPDGQVMFPTGHCIVPPTCSVTCPGGMLCDPVFPDSCFEPPPCPAPIPDGMHCGDYGLVPDCECPSGQARDPDPSTPSPCMPCAETDHYFERLGACLPGTVRCDAAMACANPGELCQLTIPDDGTWCVPDGGPCGPGFAFCDGVCTDVSSDPTNCGDCFTACASDEACIDGFCEIAPPPGCACAPGEICLADGSCIGSGSCTTVPAPDCSGSGAAPGELQAMRVATTPFTTELQRTDLHIADNPTGTGTFPQPGWTMYWRTETGAIQSAFASVQGGGTSCYDVGPVGRVGICGGASPNVDLLDVRTIYAGAATGPFTIMATGSRRTTSSGPSVASWKVSGSAAVGFVPTNICVETPAEWTSGYNNVQGIAIVPVGPAVSVDAALKDTRVQDVMGRFSPGSRSPTMSDPGAVGLRGDLAAGEFSTLFARTGGLQVTRFFGGTTSSDVGLAGARLSPTWPVAAINSQGTSLSETFVLARDTGSIRKLSCDADTCFTDDSLMGAAQDPASPLAAYTFTDPGLGSDETVVIATEGADSGGLQLIRYRSVTDVTPVLSPEMVGGIIVKVLSVDAESIEDATPGGAVNGWNHVWAAFVVVERAGMQSLELWTGADRQCT